MDISRLANVIFDRGQKITQTRYQSICESIANDRFTLDEYVLEYKLKEQFVGKIPYMLNDGTKVLVSKDLIEAINSLEINKTQVECYMYESLNNFKNIVSLVMKTNNAKFTSF